MYRYLTSMEKNLKRKIKIGDFISYDDKTYDMNGEVWITKEIGIVYEKPSFTTLKILNAEGKIITLNNIQYKNIKKIGVSNERS